jgi:hypothetical protein
LVSRYCHTVCRNQPICRKGKLLFFSFLSVFSFCSHSIPPLLLLRPLFLALILSFSFGLLFSISPLSSSMFLSSPLSCFSSLSLSLRLLFSLSSRKKLCLQGIKSHSVVPRNSSSPLLPLRPFVARASYPFVSPASSPALRRPACILSLPSLRLMCFLSPVLFLSPPSALPLSPSPVASPLFV